MPKHPDFDRAILINSLYSCPLNMMADQQLRETYSDMREILICSLCESDAFQHEDLTALFLMHYAKATFLHPRVYPTSATAAVMRFCHEVFARASLYHMAEPARTQRYHSTMEYLAK